MTDSALKLAARLLRNGLRFQYQKRAGKAGRPQTVSLEITHECIAKCMMCNIWKIPREVPNLPIEAWIRILSSSLFRDLRELDITGGEPFIRNDLADLFSGICRLRQENRLTRLKSASVTTNGIITDRVLANTEKGLRMLAGQGLDLVMVCAVDAIGETHDRIRGFKDAWSRVARTIEGLIGLREKYSNLIIGLKTTVLPVNIGELENIAQYAKTRGLFTIISPRIVTDGRYLNRDRAGDLVFKEKDTKRMIRFFEKDLFPWRYHADTLLDYFRTGEVKKPCSCGFNYLFIRSTGDLYLCPLINRNFGKADEESISDLFCSERASRFRRGVGSFPECRQCTEPGLERYALPYEGFRYLSMLFRMGKRKFFQLHHHMGLDKYI